MKRDGKNGDARARANPATRYIPRARARVSVFRANEVRGPRGSENSITIISAAGLNFEREAAGLGCIREFRGGEGAKRTRAIARREADECGLASGKGRGAVRRGWARE